MHQRETKVVGINGSCCALDRCHVAPLPHNGAGFELSFLALITRLFSIGQAVADQPALSPAPLPKVSGSRFSVQGLKVIVY